MKTCSLCDVEAVETTADPHSSVGLFRRVWRSVQWLFPTALWVLMPKCPMCVAAYVLLFTGVGISVSTAHWIQILMPVLCLLSLVYFTVGWWRSRRVHQVCQLK